MIVIIITRKEILTIVMIHASRSSPRYSYVFERTE